MALGDSFGEWGGGVVKLREERQRKRGEPADSEIPIFSAPYGFE